jgi:hypothetical protein
MQPPSLAPAKDVLSLLQTVERSLQMQIVHMDKSIIKNKKKRTDLSPGKSDDGKRRRKPAKSKHRNVVDPLHVAEVDSLCRDMEEMLIGERKACDIPVSRVPAAFQVPDSSQVLALLL